MVASHGHQKPSPKISFSLNDETHSFIKDNLSADLPALALRKAPENVDLSLALRQIEARQLLRKKVPEWADNEQLLFPARVSIEQGSSEATARYKAQLLQGDTFADLTGGLGIDTYYLSQHFAKADYVEANADLCELARHNFNVLQTPIAVHNETAESFLAHCGTYDCLYLDPSRRDAHGRKTIAIADCAPNVADLQDLLLQKAHTVLIKLSPMLDISQALNALRHVKEVHIVAVANECKELVFRFERGFSGPTTLCCANLQTPQPEMRFTLDDERDCPLRLAETVGKYLYEPNAALLKAGCFRLPAQWFEVGKLHPSSHLYTSDTLVAGFPGRVFEVKGWAAYNKRVRNGLLAETEKANLAVRNFPMGADELRKSLKMSDGGEIYLFATTLRDGEKVLVKTKKAAP